MKNRKTKSRELEKVVGTMKGYKWLKNGYASFKGYVIDLTAIARWTNKNWMILLKSIINNMEKRTPKTADEARQYAMDWQEWASEQNLPYAHLCYWQGIFMTLAEEFNLIEEFKENGII